MPSSQICTPLLPATVPRESQHTLVLRAFLAVCVNQDSRTQQEQVFLLLDGESGSPGGVSLLRPCHAIMCVGLSAASLSWSPQTSGTIQRKPRKSVNFRTVTPLQGSLLMGEGGSSASSILDWALGLTMSSSPSDTSHFHPKRRDTMAVTCSPWYIRNRPAQGKYL